MAKSSGEMPFLDHLEELRGRIIKALGAVIVAVGIGLWAVPQFDLIKRIATPIKPYLRDGKLMVTSPTEALMITLKLGVVLGLVLASPVIIYQLWAFLSPALYAREKKAMLPAVFAGFILFLIGAVIGWLILPPTYDFLLTWQAENFAPNITFKEYFGFTVQMLVAFGIAFELPLVMMLVAWLGLMSSKKYIAMGRYALFFCAVGGAILSPSPDAISMIVFTIPLLGLYALGVGGSWVVERRKVARQRREAIADAADA